MDKYINVEKTIRTLCSNIRAIMRGHSIRNIIETIPTIEIVHCKDCKKQKTWKCPFYRAGYTYKRDDYCSDAERLQDD